MTFVQFYPFDCRGGLTAEAVLLHINDFLKRNGVDALEGVTTMQAPIEVKIDYLGQVLSQIKMLVIFDNFETLLREDKAKWEIADAELKNSLKSLVNQCKEGTRFLFTSRNTFNLMDGRLTNVMDEINLGELSRPESIMVMNKFPDIAKEEFSVKWNIFVKIGGHPYTINIFGKQAKITSVTEVLMDIGDVNKEMVDFTLLDSAYKHLTPEARELLHRVSVFRKSIALEALEWMMKDNGVFPSVTEEIEELFHWGLFVKLSEIEEKEGALYQVHTLVKDFIQPILNTSPLKMPYFSYRSIRMSLH